MVANIAHSFQNRTLQDIRDLSKDEQLYLYKYAQLYKHAVRNKDRDFLSSHIINSNNFSAYLLFQEHSTRTRESFYNAAKFHQIRVKDLSLANSSMEKQESFTDTVKTLLGYNEHSCFIIRSGIEGVCRWLEVALQEFISKNTLQMPFFINAGDGQNEHPTQEFLDEFTFLEYYKGNHSHIHIALIGDLLNGRTVHSKCEGLRIFNEVAIDLVAPPEISLPVHYIHEMEANGFEVRIFESVEEYLAQDRLADIWYFTRLQKERLSDSLFPHIERIHSRITFDISYQQYLHESTLFLHPLPRDKTMPTIPYQLDSSPVNGWDNQSINGYYIRVTLLSMFKGIIGEDFEGERKISKMEESDFVTEKAIAINTQEKKVDYKIGIKPVENGLVIDHIARGQDIVVIWNKIDLIRRIMQFNMVSSHGVYESQNNSQLKGIISIPDYTIDKLGVLEKLGAISPQCTLNVIKNSKVIQKLCINQPPRIYNFSEISCRNPRCISHHSSLERAHADFYRKNIDTLSLFEEEVREYEYLCKYCKTPHNVGEIWNLK